MVEQDHTQEGEAPFESEDEHQDEWRSSQSAMEDEPVLVEVHLSEARLTNGMHNEGKVIPAGYGTIYHAESNIILHDGVAVQNIHTKLDSCGSVSIAHSSFITQVKGSREHGLPPIRLTGIGGRTGTLNMVGIEQLVGPGERVKKIQC
jgi:hypothetical protein